MTTTTDHRPAWALHDERTERLDADLAAATERHRVRRATTAAVISCMHEARRILPSFAAADPVAAWQTVWAMREGSDDDFRYLLHQACTSGLTVWAADTALEAPVIERAGELEYLAPPPDSNTSAVNDRPRVKRANGTVRGHVRRPVVGSVSGVLGDFMALDAREVLRLTDEWCDANGVELDPLIGTDDYSWQEEHNARLLVVDDAMGDSLVGRGDRRIRLRDRGTKVSYRRIASGLATYVRRGGTAYRFIGHGPAEPIRHRGSSRADRAAAVKVADMPLARDAAAATIAAWCHEQHGTGATVSQRWHIAGIGTVTVRHDATARSYRATLTTTVNGRKVSSKLTDTRKVATVAAAITRATTAA